MLKQEKYHLMLERKIAVGILTSYNGRKNNIKSTFSQVMNPDYFDQNTKRQLMFIFLN